MKTFLSFFLLIAAGTLLFSQVPPSPAPPVAAAPPAKAAVAKDLYTSSLTRIKRRLPDFDDATVNCDKAVIENTLPAITEKLKSAGFTAEDATEATLNGWENVRLRSALPSTKCMVQKSFQEYVGELGRMHFRSSPSGATIEVDAQPLQQNTDSKRWFEPKEYKVKYTRPDCCLPVETTCKINESAETDCFAELPKKP